MEFIDRYYIEFINRYVWNLLTDIILNLSTDMYGIYRQIRVEFIDRYVWNLLTDIILNLSTDMELMVGHGVCSVLYCSCTVASVISIKDECFMMQISITSHCLILYSTKSKLWHGPNLSGLVCVKSG